eukprot:TRINITY_DN46608_c0_g1_i1.p1 TRINITY_DN46608_c0_g1~~TRINITY_DN46608_c0_g1_i1.p1  ORF type:complete len:383 (+),score=33.05 TRINITY_DN46608_c0_g1_i1:30-1178(+)
MGLACSCLDRSKNEDSAQEVLLHPLHDGNIEVSCDRGLASVSDAELPLTLLNETLPDAARERLLSLWNDLLALRAPCTSTLFPTRYERLDALLGNYDDLHADLGRQKRISSQGAVCLVRLRFWEHKYTGLFRRADYGLMRLSSALPSNLANPTSPILPKAPGTLKEAVLVPFVAMKFFRNGHGSGNLLFGAQKTGQKESDFFAHAVCTHVTERCSLLMRPLLNVFRRHSQFPTQTGLSDFASVCQNGVNESNPQFPWALMLRPSRSVSQSKLHRVQKNFLQQLRELKAGTVLYDVVACPSPAEAKAGPLQHIGEVIMETSFIESSLEASLRFRHQLKEDDYAVMPGWKDLLTKDHVNYGWRHFSTLPIRALSKEGTDDTESV